MIFLGFSPNLRKKMHQRADIQVRLGDCLPILQGMESDTVDLVYLDPPFFTQKVHRLSPRDRSREFSFDDLWSTQKEYATFLFERLREIHRVVSKHGSIFFHCDRNAVHLVRACLTRSSGPRTFARRLSGIIEGGPTRSEGYCRPIRPFSITRKRTSTPLTRF